MRQRISINLSINGVCASVQLDLFLLSSVCLSVDPSVHPSVSRKHFIFGEQRTSCIQTCYPLTCFPLGVKRKRKRKENGENGATTLEEGVSVGRLVGWSVGQLVDP